jgi:hypothetical protein
MSTETRVFRMKEDDERFGLLAGDLLECEAYWLDPQAKLTVLQRLSDGFDPSCNVYRYQVEPVRSAATR